MVSLQLICIYFILTTVISDGQAVYRGAAAEEGQFKYMVFVSILGKHSCGGAIIDENHILSAAHCYPGASESDVAVYANILEVCFREAGVIREVRKITLHEEYKPPAGDSSSCQESSEDPNLNDKPTNDIAMLTLSEPLSFTENIDKVPYKPIGNPSADCNQCVFAGYGKYLRSRTPCVLRWTIFEILSPQECSELEVPHRENQLCAIDRNEITCMMKGDSGSPLVCNGILVGIASTARPNPTYPGTYSDVSKHIDFIERVLKEDEV